jgi:Spy/CpxP family protein refolding chaperone
MKRILAVAALILAVATFAIAQPHPGPGGDAMRDHLDQAATYLNLTADQKAAWSAAVSDFESQQKSQMTKSHDLQKQLHEAITATSPDPCNIGNLTLQSHAAMEQLTAAHNALVAKLASSLTPDQKTKFDAYMASMMVRHREGPPPPMH